MEDGKLSTTRLILEHSNLISPEAYYRFIHLDGFEADWKALGFVDDELNLLQIQIMMGPLEPQVIPGTGGIRKMYFSPPPPDGAGRVMLDVFYAAFPDYGTAVLAAAQMFDMPEDISPEDKAALQIVMREIEEALERGE